MYVLFILIGAIISIIAYAKIGEHIAQKWYIPNARRIALDSLINLPEKEYGELEALMKWGWIIFAPLEALSDFMMFRFAY